MSRQNQAHRPTSGERAPSPDQDQAVKPGMPAHGLDVGRLFRDLNNWLLAEEGEQGSNRELTSKIVMALLELKDEVITPLTPDQMRVVDALYGHPYLAVWGSEAAQRARMSDERCAKAISELSESGIVRVVDGTPGTLEGRVVLDPAVRLAEAVYRNDFSLRVADVKRTFGTDELL